MSTLFHRAADPKQYDLLKIDWQQEATLQSPYRLFFWEYLKEYKANWQGKTVLDVGAGSGWFLEEIRVSGAQSVTGIEPSKNNIQMGEKLFPKVTLKEAKLEDFVSNEKFDCVFSVMVFPHIADAEQGFKKIKELCKEEAAVYVVVPDFNYYTKDAEGRAVLNTQQMSGDEYVVEVKRANGVLVDIVRTNDYYVRAAQAAGLRLQRIVPMIPTEQLKQNVKRYRNMGKQAITDLFIYSV